MFTHHLVGTWNWVICQMSVESGIQVLNIDSYWKAISLGAIYLLEGWALVDCQVHIHSAFTQTKETKLYFFDEKIEKINNLLYEVI